MLTQNDSATNIVIALNGPMRFGKTWTQQQITKYCTQKGIPSHSYSSGQTLYRSMLERLRFLPEETPPYVDFKNAQYNVMLNGAWQKVQGRQLLVDDVETIRLRRPEWPMPLLWQNTLANFAEDETRIHIIDCIGSSLEGDYLFDMSFDAQALNPHKLICASINLGGERHGV